MTTRLRPVHVGKFVPPPYAGVEAHIDTLLKVLPPHAEGSLVAADSPVSGASAAVQTLSYRVVPARSFGKFASATLSPSVPTLVRRELRSQRSNLLHIHAPNPWGDLSALMVGRDVPLVMTWHSDIVRQKKLMVMYQHIQRRVLDRVQKIIVYTPMHYESSQQLHQLDVDAKVEVVPLGVDLSTLDAVNSDGQALITIDAFARNRPVLLTVGRHVPYKGYRYLIEAMSTLRSETVLLMIGTGVLTPELKRQAEELGLSERILFMGEVSPSVLVTALHRCDAFCLPSIEISEAFGLASAEAMACGKPTIVCELGNGVNYLNQQGKTSLTVAPMNVPALADAIDIMMRDDAMRANMGASAKAWVHSQFSIQAMKSGVIRVYEALV